MTLWSIVVIRPCKAFSSFIYQMDTCERISPMKSCNIRSQKRAALDEAEKTSFAQLHPALVRPRAALGSRPVHGKATASGRWGRRRGVQIRSRQAALCVDLLGRGPEMPRSCCGGRELG